MFSHSSSAASKELGPHTNMPNGAGGLQHRASGPESDSKSVIGNDLKIFGKGLKITGRGVLQIDGEIDSDVQAAEIIVGEHGKVTGMVAGQHVLICGEVAGIICGKTVALTASSRVEGDVYHMSLALEQGGQFEGRSRRAADESELNSVVDARSARQATGASHTD
jgi:cytoskeletal protein CcmA (bactofilin family)